MSNDQKRGADSAPPEARRRGGMDTLFSAPWFDQAPPAGGGASGEVEKPARSNRTLIIVAAVVALVIVPMLLCGLSAVAGGIWYAVQNGMI